MAPQAGEVTVLLHRLKSGDSQALSELAPLVGAELRRLAAGYLHGPQGYSWQPTDLVNELWIRFLGRSRLEFQNRAHFLGVAAHLMRVMVIDHARARSAAKRRPPSPSETDELQACLPLTEERALELLALEDALTRLAGISPRQAEIVELRYFAGLTVEEAGAALEISPATVKREWDKARAWLHARMRGLDV